MLRFALVASLLGLAVLFLPAVYIDYHWFGITIESKSFQIVKAASIFIRENSLGYCFANFALVAVFCLIPLDSKQRNKLLWLLGTATCLPFILAFYYLVRIYFFYL